MTRLDKFEALSKHVIYGPLARRLPERDFDFIVEFLKENDHLDNNTFTLKVNRLFLTSERSKFHAIICDLLLASRI